MKKSILIISVFSVSLFPVRNAYCQSIDEQFKTVVDGSNNYQSYKVIKQSQIQHLWKNTVDTLNKKESRYLTISKKLAEQQASIKAQKVALDKKEESLQNTLNSANEISMMGFININKSTYRTIMWGLVFVLAGLAAFLYLGAISSRKEAKYRIKLFEDLQEEFKAFKIKSNDNEKRLARALQDERNKLEEYNIR